MTLDRADIDSVLEQVREALTTEDWRRAVALVEALRPPDQADVFEELSLEDQDTLMQRLDPEDSADILEELEEQDAAEVAERLEPEDLTRILDAMEHDELADLLGDIAPERVTEALEQIEDAEDVLPLLIHPDESAGGLMTSAEVVLHIDISVDEALQHLRSVSPDTESIYYLFVVDDQVRLVGVVPLRQLVIADPSTRIEDILDTDVISVQAGIDQEEAARLMLRYDLLALPVVDEQNHLLGVITHDDLTDVLKDEATEDILRLGAIESGPVIDKPYWAQKITDVVRSRFVWLLILFGAATFTGTVLRHFQGELEQVVALSFFVPLLIGTGGNAGFQTVSTVIRALALREVRSRDMLRVWWREARAGLILGIMLGILGYIWAMVWGVDADIALTVGLTVSAICLWATTVAALIPIAAHALHIDPTVVSGPMMSTLIDGTGLIIYFTLAALILDQLQ